MRVGTLCFATKRGLGYLAKSFYDNGVITDVAVLSHGKIKTEIQWYPDGFLISSRPFLNDRLKIMIAEVDVMLFFETPFDWNIINYCRSVDVKTALITMYECTPARLPYVPDLFLCPSELDMEYFPNNSVMIPVPVDEPWVQRTQANVFVHNSGYIGLKGRSGTQELINAVKYIESDLELIIRSQDPIIFDMANTSAIDSNDNMSISSGIFNYDDLRTGCDVCIAPEKFNGLSLPLQECRASGMLVMTTDRFPANSWLPKEPLIPITGYRPQRVGRQFITFDEAQIDPRDIAKTMDEWYGKDITDYSLSGKYWAEEMSWEVLKPKYLEALLA